MTVTGAYSFLELAAVNGQVNGQNNARVRDIPERSSKLTTMSNASIQSTPEDNRIKDELCHLIFQSFIPTNNQENCRVILSEQHVSKIADLIIANSTNEPCGVHGCCFKIELEGDIPGRKMLRTHKFGEAVGVAPTHEIYLILKDVNGKKQEDIDASIKLFSKIKQYLITKIHSTKVVSNPQYRIEKKRFFRSAKTPPAASPATP